MLCVQPCLFICIASRLHRNRMLAPAQVPLPLPPPQPQTYQPMTAHPTVLTTRHRLPRGIRTSSSRITGRSGTPPVETPCPWDRLPGQQRGFPISLDQYSFFPNPLCEHFVYSGNCSSPCMHDGIAHEIQNQTERFLLQTNHQFGCPITSNRSLGWIGFASSSKLWPFFRAASIRPPAAICPENRKILHLGSIALNGTPRSLALNWGIMTSGIRKSGH
jgi:hypothetical protein